MKKPATPKPADLLTPRELHAYKLVLKFYSRNGHAPTILDVAKLDGKETPATITTQLRGLNKKKWVSLPTEGRGRGVQVPQLRDATKALAAAMERAALKTLPRTGGEPIQPGDPPTPLQGRMYKLLLKCFAKNGFPPTLRELTDEAEESSTSVVVAHMKGLHKRGFVVVNRPAKGGRKTRNLEVPKLREATKSLATRLLAETA